MNVFFVFFPIIDHVKGWLKFQGDRILCRTVFMVMMGVADAESCHVPDPALRVRSSFVTSFNPHIHRRQVPLLLLIS